MLVSITLPGPSKIFHQPCFFVIGLIPVQNWSPDKAHSILKLHYFFFYSKSSISFEKQLHMNLCIFPESSLIEFFLICNLSIGIKDFIYFYINLFDLKRIITILVSSQNNFIFESKSLWLVSISNT